MKRRISIATRNSPLALWQAEYVKQQLMQIDPSIECVVIGKLTQGDRIKRLATSNARNKALFVKDLQQMVLRDRADIAVHSAKDLSVFDTPGLVIGAYCERGDVRDALISVHGKSFMDLKEGAVIGTSSPRRRSQILGLRPNLIISDLRGNVGTRLKKLEGRKLDALVLAAAGLERLGLEKKITHYFDPKQLIPAIGQGALAVECREDCTDMRNLLCEIDHRLTRICVTAERAVNRQLKGGCYTPLAAHASISSETLHLTALVGTLDGTRILKSNRSGSLDDPETLGFLVGEDLLEAGADEILLS